MRGCGFGSLMKARTHLGIHPLINKLLFPDQEDAGDALVFTSLPIPLPLKRQLVEEWEAISHVSSCGINTT